jgi:hypothetical protein
MPLPQRSLRREEEAGSGCMRAVGVLARGAGGWWMMWRGCAGVGVFVRGLVIYDGVVRGW